jgi:hypothetical protein
MDISDEHALHELRTTITIILKNGEIRKYENVHYEILNSGVLQIVVSRQQFHQVTSYSPDLWQEIIWTEYNDL